MPSSLEEAFRLEYEKAMKKKQLQGEEYDELNYSDEDDGNGEENSYGFDWTQTSLQERKNIIGGK